jgi:predicted DNA-binding transcriptional regulator AlpA
MTIKTIRRNQVQKKIGDCSAVTIWRYQKNDPTFPKPLDLGGVPHWLESEIDEWILKKADARKDKKEPATA